MKNKLIGISGKIGSGKDTVGNILQYLSTPKGSNEFTLQDYLTDSSSYLYAGNKYQIKKFADKLKDIACLLIGCTREQLEDREFKEKELGEEWWFWKVYSDIRNNKFELISYKKEEKGFYNRKPNYKGHSLQKLTPRKLLQLLGTECGRQIIHPNIWVNALFADYTKHQRYERGTEIVGLTDGKTVVDYEIPSIEYDFPSWIITDCRFPNEAKAIKARGGIVIRINRPQYLDNGLVIRKDEHLSETALDDYEFDAFIENDGSIEELVEKVKQLKLI